jgi:ATP-dependent Clp protease adaptor protein ClpS
MVEVEEEVLVEQKSQVDPGRAIILHNDEVNSFDHVIECLMKYCGHEQEQATQCSYIVHNNGKCDVKRGSLDKLKPIHEALLDQGLKTTIEKIS